jgi:hypothetical protein
MFASIGTQALQFLQAALKEIKKDVFAKKVIMDTELLVLKQAITICIARGAAQMIRKGQRMANRL